MNKIKRYLVFLIGLFINSLGVSLITKANMGTSPISSIPYVLSLSFPFSLGQFTIAFSLVLILLQALILKKNFKAEHLLQIPISILFGYFIDLTMEMLFFVAPATYISCIVYLLIGCVVLGFGVYIEVLANVAMLPGESFVRAVSSTWKTEFGITKVVFDVSISVIAALLSLVLVHRLNGVREGTIVAALLVGFIARLFGRKLAFLEAALFGDSAKKAQQNTFAENDEAKPVIVIGRQFGSGGHDIGQALAKQLGYDFYDNEIISMAAGSTGYDPEFIKNNEENLTNGLLYDLMSQMYIYSSNKEAPRDEIFESEANVIRSLAQKGNCVIIGRCADQILHNRPNTLKVFLHAPESYRVQRIMQNENLTQTAATHKIHKMDRRRADNYAYFTRAIWGHAVNYDLTLDTSIGEENVIHLIIQRLRYPL